MLLNALYEVLCGFKCQFYETIFVTTLRFITGLMLKIGSGSMYFVHSISWRTMNSYLSNKTY